MRLTEMSQGLYEHDEEPKKRHAGPLSTYRSECVIPSRRGSFSCPGLASEHAQFGWCSMAESSKSFQEPQPASLPPSAPDQPA